MLGTAGIRCIQPLDVFPLTSIVNKSCNIECCVNNMLKIIQTMMVSEGLELELSMFIRPASLGLGTGPKYFEISIQPAPPIIFQWELGVEYF